MTDSKTASCGKPMLSVVAVCTDERDDLYDCLVSIFTNGINSTRLDVVVVDNHSSDGSAEMARDRFPEVTVLRNDRRRGFAHNANRGLERCSAEYILITNSDVVLRPGSLQALWEFMESDSQVAVCGPRILYRDGRLQLSCRRFPSLPAVILRRIPAAQRLLPEGALEQYLMMDDPHDASREVDWVSSCCLMIRRAALEEIGGFDERYRLYCEDVDWCYRAWLHGWRVAYFPVAEVIHRASYASRKGLFGKNARIHLRSMLRFWLKNHINVFHPNGIPRSEDGHKEECDSPITAAEGVVTLSEHR